MEMNRGDLLGSALLLWVGAALLALYLLCNPAAATLREPFDTARLWGAVLGLVLLGAALPTRHLLLWLLFLGTLPLLLFPTPLNRSLGTAAFLGTSALSTFLLAGRFLCRRKRGRPADKVEGAKRTVRRKGEGAGRGFLRRPVRHFRLRTRAEGGSAPEMPAEEEVQRGE